MAINNLETLLNSYLEKFKRIDSEEIRRYTSEFSKLLLDYKKEHPDEALDILNKYRRIRYERNNETP